jgi:hypothetical protein
MALLIGNIVLLAKVSAATYVHIASAVLFLMLFVSKEHSLMKS